MLMSRNRVGTIAAVCLSLLVVAPVYAQQRQGGSGTSPAGKTILMICGDENRTVLPCTSIGDVFVKNHLELDMGHKVLRMPHDTEAGKMLAAANGADLVIIVESVGSGTVGTKIVSTPTPVLTSEAFLQDEFGFVNPKGKSVDPGLPDAAAFGAIENQTAVTITNPGHPLAAGLKGRVQVYRFPREMNWGKDTVPGAETIATLTDYPTAKLIYMVRKGAKLYDGSPAPGLRIQFFIENDNETGTVNLMTADGLRLWDAAINYALITDQPATRPAMPVVDPLVVPPAPGGGRRGGQPPAPPGR
jgi:hypothetical protein